MSILKYTPKLPQTNDNVTPSSPLKEFFVLVGGLLGIVVGIYIVLGLLVDFVVPRISLETEQRIAGFFSQLTDASEKASERVDYLQSLADQLEARCAPLPYDIKVYVYENEIANAVALPGGTIVVFSGLLEKMTTENELAFVMSHELGHFYHRDHLRVMGRSVIFMALSALLLGSDSNIGGILAQSVGVTEMGFSRVQETRADEFGVTSVNCRYGHMGGAIDFFEKMKHAEDPTRFGQYFASHPDMAERIKHILDFGREKGFPLGQRKALPIYLNK